MFGLNRWLFGVIWLLAAGVSLATNQNSGSLPVYGQLGGELSLDATDPVRIDAADVKLVSFGFAQCSDVCPMVLAKYAQVIRALNNSAPDLAAIFVSIDVERDTLQDLEDFLDNFHQQIVGLVGDEQQIKGALGQFAAFAEKIEGSGDYSHTDRMYLLDDQDRVRAMFKPMDSTQSIVQAIRALQ